MKTMRLVILVVSLLFVGLCASVSGYIARGGDPGLGALTFVAGLLVAASAVIFVFRKS